MKFLNYCNPQDVAIRLYARNRFWFYGNPKIDLVGENGKFGKLKFDFGDNVIVSMNIFIKDKEMIIDAANYAVINFKSITKEIADQGLDLPIDRSSQGWSI